MLDLLKGMFSSLGDYPRIMKDFGMMEAIT